MLKLGAALICLLGLATAALAQQPGGAGPGLGPQTIPLATSATGTTGAISATLTGVAGRNTYICGFVVTSGGTTASNVQTVTVTGLQNTLSYIYVFVSSGQGILGIAYPGCWSAGTMGGNIVVNVPGGGAGTSAAVSAWGYTN
jgi:hypothetical protein